MKHLLLLFLCWNWLEAAPTSNNSADYYLENGMRVILQPMGEDKEVFIQISAKGGFSILPTYEQAAGALASEIATHSLSLSCSDMNAMILPFQRKIEGSCWKDETSHCFKMATLFFTWPLMTENDLHKARKSPLRSLNIPRQSSFEMESRLLNSHNWSPFLSLTKEQITKISLDSASKFYRHSFSNPSEFVCVVTGDFKLDTVKNEIAHSLGCIPSTKHSYFKEAPLFPSFPDQILEKRLVHKERKDALCRLTFPLQTVGTDYPLDKLQNISLLVEILCRNAFKKQFIQAQGLNVSLDFPFFPYLDGPRLLIQFHGAHKDIDSLTRLVIATLNDVIESGIHQKTIDYMVKTSQKKPRITEKEASIEIVEISNYALAGWQKTERGTSSQATLIQSEALYHSLKHALNPNVYTKIIAAP